MRTTAKFGVGLRRGPFNALAFLITLALVLMLSISQPVITGSSAASPTSAITCSADLTLDALDIGEYFSNFQTDARKEWRKDAIISSIRLDDRTGKNFDALCKVNIYSSWMIVLYSPSLKKEEVVYMDGQNLTAAGIPRVLYSVKKSGSNSTSFTSKTFVDIKKKEGWVFDSYTRQEKVASEKKGDKNPLLGWKISLGEIIQKFLDQVRNEKITNYGWSIYIGMNSVKSKSVYASIYWQNGLKKQAFFVEPVTLKSYLIKY